MADQEWLKLLSAGSVAGVIGWVVWWLLTKTIPAMQEVFAEALNKVVADHELARETFAKELQVERAIFSENLSKERHAHANQLNALHLQMHERDRALLEEFRRLLTPLPKKGPPHE